jgi:hypothetical protein
MQPGIQLQSRVQLGQCSHRAIPPPERVRVMKPPDLLFTPTEVWSCSAPWRLGSAHSASVALQAQMIQPAWLNILMGPWVCWQA